MKALKEKLEEIKGENPALEEVPININPAAVGPLSAEDQAALANGGQIQYRTLPNGEVMKLTLDPGSNGEGDGLTIGVYKPGSDHSLEQQSLSAKIPLKFVFEGAEFNGKKVGPFLKDWRESKLFENSVIHAETNLRGTKTRKTNEDDVSRIQTQNKLWNAVNEYLKASVETTEGHFDTNNKAKPSEAKNDKQDTKTVSKDQPTSQSSLNIDPSEIHELSNSTSASFSTELNPEIATPVNETSQTVVNTEESTQQQAEKINTTTLNIDLGEIYELSGSLKVNITPKIEQTLKPIEENINKLTNEEIEVEELKQQFATLKTVIQAHAKSPKKTKVRQFKFELQIPSQKDLTTEDLLTATKNLNKEMEKMTKILIDNLDIKEQIDWFISLGNGTKKMTKGFDLLGKLTILGISNSKIREKTEQLNLDDNNDINRLFSLLQKYNKDPNQQTQHYTTEDDYLNGFADWIKNSQALYGTE